jgi:hypothetical protein
MTCVIPPDRDVPDDLREGLPSGRPPGVPFPDRLLKRATARGRVAT